MIFLKRSNRGATWIVYALAAGFYASVALTAAAQTPDVKYIGKDSVQVIAGPHFRASAAMREAWGENYRREWTTPITVPVLDLGTFRGGLTPTKEGGGMHAPNLRLVACSRGYVRSAFPDRSGGSRTPSASPASVAWTWGSTRSTIGSIGRSPMR